MNKKHFIYLPTLFQKQWISILFIYHCLFIYFAYIIRIVRGKSDALLYWAITFDIDKYSWLSFAKFGTPFIIFINYPFIKLGFPFWFGFILYGLVGFLGVLMYIKWIHIVLGTKWFIQGFNMIPVLYFLPNLHFWTSGLGKEPLVFFGLASVFYAFTIEAYKSFSFVVGALLILIIRPHVALMLLLSWALVYFFKRKISLKKRLLFTLIYVLILSFLLYIVFKMTHIRYWDWQRINYFNEYSIHSFRFSGSYVPMLDYNWFYKMFSFYFRPLFYDANSILSLFSSLENVFVLSIHIIGLYFIVRFRNKIIFTEWLKWILVFTLVCGILYVERYANLGIFMRTKMMFQPFIIVGLLFIIKQSFTFQRSKII
ncbi:hypothetical protein [Flavobacterium luteum]|uniref:Uncharacterized protein n=1 Tax=Flavobacterium luteum TaxID=2026654 RepID=A0A7J5AE30_9FLAO|nr:hypothetical protein [Flavobacterium luteum]KAB1155841.1 hypothetical protein F6464_09970 [Flavobacterium luteum]